MKYLPFAFMLVLVSCTTTSIPAIAPSTNCQSQRVVCRQEVHEASGVQDFLRRLPGVTIQNGNVFVRGSEALFVIDGTQTFSVHGLVGSDIEVMRVITDPSETSRFTGTSHDIIQIVTRIR